MLEAKPTRVDYSKTVHGLEDESGGEGANVRII